MFVPGHRERFLRSAVNSDADILLIDFEDSVQPKENKEIARELVKKLFKEGLFKGRRIFPRVNDLDSGDLLKDILAVAELGIEGFLYPKSNEPGDIIFFDKLLEAVENDLEIPVGTLKIIVLIETPAAVLNCEKICSASPRVIAATFGSEDYLAELQGNGGEDNSLLTMARAMIAMGARAAGVTPIDTVHVDINDLDGLERNIAISKSLGFDGMLVLHPKQIPLAHDGYSATTEEIEYAIELVRRYKDTVGCGQGIAYNDGVFVGPPLVRRAEKLLVKQFGSLDKIKK